jgi:2-polyprenyl-3-methyl-5-hydroxy-6-metoxy-1,4-benzoquinol methylase
MPHTTTNGGLHEFVGEHVLAQYAKRGIRACDLGSGPGAMAARLQALGCEVVAADRDPAGFEAATRHVTVDFDQPDFAAEIGAAQFSIVTAIEVIEHVESPIGFLANVARLLAGGGIAVITTPNVDCLPARIKLLIAGRIRTMDEHGEPTHISPIFLDLFRRQYVKRAGLRLREHRVFPPRGYQLSRKSVAVALGLLARVLPGEALLGDNHVFVLERGTS